MWIKTIAALTIGTALAGCNTPSPAFRGIPAQTVTVGQSTFDVRRDGTSVEVLRTNAEFAPTPQSVISRAADAVRQATGCTPVPGTWTGEQTMMQVKVDCPDL